VVKDKSHELSDRIYSRKLTTMRDQYVFKICTVGSNYELNKGILQLVTESEMEPDRSQTIGVNILSKGVTVEGQKLKLLFHLVRPEKVFERLRRFYFEGSVGCIIVYEKEDQKAFEAVYQWCKEYQIARGKEKPIALLGIINENEQVTSEEGKTLADELEIHYFECKPSDGKEILTAIKFLVEKIIEIDM
jgi:Ras-related protein Rab-2A